MNTCNKIRRLPRAIRVSHFRRKARDAEHVQWAASLLTPAPEKTLLRSTRTILDKAGICSVCGHPTNSYGHYAECGGR